MAIEPDADQIAELSAGAGGPDDGPLVMLNLNRYRERADYGAETGETEGLSGRDAYARYAAVALATLGRLGGKILWHADAQQTVVGDESDAYDEVIAVWYPSRAAFLELATDAAIQQVLPDRTAGLERAALIRCASGAEPVLAGIAFGE